MKTNPVCILYYEHHKGGPELRTPLYEGSWNYMNDTSSGWLAGLASS